jgi:hypothetical protein
MYVAHAEDREEARRQITACYERFLSGLGITDAPAVPVAETVASTGRQTTAF